MRNLQTYFDVKETSFILSSDGFTKFIIQPSFASLTDDTKYDAASFAQVNKGFIVMDDVKEDSKGRPIVDIWQQFNVLHPMNADCTTTTSQLLNVGTRQINTSAVGANTDLCLNGVFIKELEKYRSNPEWLLSLTVQALFKAICTDTKTNTWFGNVTRPNPTNATGGYTQSGLLNIIMGVNSFNGVLYYLGVEYTNGNMPSGQVMTITQGDPTNISPAEAVAVFQNMYNAQNNVMLGADDSTKCYYVNRRLYEAYRQYQRIGNGGNLGTETSTLINIIQHGIEVPSFNGIPIFVEPTWDNALLQINSYTKTGGVYNQYNLAILTLQGNFIFAYDKSFGIGAYLNATFRAWYSDDADMWKYRFASAMGAQIANPQMVVLAATNTTTLF